MKFRLLPFWRLYQGKFIEYIVSYMLKFKINCLRKFFYSDMIKISMHKVRKITEQKFEKASIQGLAGYELGDKI